MQLVAPTLGPPLLFNIIVKKYMKQGARLADCLLFSESPSIGFIQHLTLPHTHCFKSFNLWSTPNALFQTFIAILTSHGKYIIHDIPKLIDIHTYIIADPLFIALCWKAVPIQLCSRDINTYHNCASRITEVIDHIAKLGTMWSCYWYLVSDYNHPPNCGALYQEAPWQLAMNIVIEYGLEIVLPTQIS